MSTAGRSAPRTTLVLKMSVNIKAKVPPAIRGPWTCHAIGASAAAAVGCSVRHCPLDKRTPPPALEAVELGRVLRPVFSERAVEAERRHGGKYGGKGARQIRRLDAHAVLARELGVGLSHGTANRHERSRGIECHGNSGTFWQHSHRHKVGRAGPARPTL